MSDVPDKMGARHAFYLRALSTRTYLWLRRCAQGRLAVLTRQAVSSDPKTQMMWDNAARVWALGGNDRAAGLIWDMKIACILPGDETVDTLLAQLPGIWVLNQEADFPKGPPTSVFDRVRAVNPQMPGNGIAEITGQIALHQSQLIDLVASNRGEPRASVLAEAGGLVSEAMNPDPRECHQNEY
ncbi:MAG: hypothetical protein ABJI96_23480 [Paracoccaceae bacterium]